MTMTMREPAGRDKRLFTPGPLTTSLSVKQAMLHDVGSRDRQFVQIVRDVRLALLDLAGVSPDGGYETILMQGSGTFAIESVLSSAIAPDGKLLLAINGAYGTRMASIAAAHHVDSVIVRCEENEIPDVARIDRLLADDVDITHVAVVHCETTSGIINPVEALGDVVARHGRIYIVDSMSAFGAVPLNVRDTAIDYLIASSNKCIEGVPGFGLVVCRRDALTATAGWARTLSLDLLDQWRGLEANGQFRFTPPTHAILAFRQALVELDEEGGAAGRGRRYRANQQSLVVGMRKLGFREYVPAPLQGPVITSFLYPTDPRFDFETFYDRLSDKGCVIYPGKVTRADCFRIGSIGRLFEDDIRTLLAAVEATLDEMGVRTPVAY